MAKDYYQILGVDKNASNDEIKAKYRKLATKWHPDRFASKSEAERKEAEEKMKEINEANDILSDPEKRKKYDNPNPFENGSGNPFEGFNPFGGRGNPFGFDFGDFFGRGKKQEREAKGGDIRITIGVPLNEILSKHDKTIKYKRGEGSGKTCPYCGGTGMEMKVQHGMQIMSPCQHCNGSGIEMNQVEHECKFTLNGIDMSHDVSFDPTTNTISFVKVVPHEGNKIDNNNNHNGNLIVVVKCQLPFGYRVEGNATDVVVDMYVPVLTSLLGGTIEIPTIDGTRIKANIAQGTTDGSKLKFSGKGLMSQGIRGNMYGIVHLKMPKTINAQERSILEQLQGKPNFT